MATEGGIDFADLEHREMDVEESASHPETARLLAELDRKQSARRIAVPTKDADVRLRLREMGEPITLFGERPEDRRDRLRYLWSQQRQKEKDAKMQVGSDEEEESSSGSENGDEEKEEEFYTEGTLTLKAARKDIAEFSLPRCASPLVSDHLALLISLVFNRARKRVARQRSETTIPLGRLIDVRRAVFNNLKSFTNLGSQIGDTRALSSLRFSPDSSMLLTSSWTGSAKLWSVPACKEIKTIKGDSRFALLSARTELTCSASLYSPQGADRRSRVAPTSYSFPIAHRHQLRHLRRRQRHQALGSRRVCPLSSSPSLPFADSSSYSDAPLQTLTGHSARVCRIGFHPSGRYLGSASYDGTWRLWDVERGGEELLLQEGHSKEVYSIAFQGDGSLVCTG
jgi:U4/U6 small nuclear ribonucleoprotein PRP4